MIRLAFAALLLAPAAASAQSLPCAPRERVLAFVVDQHHQTRLATGDAARGATIELFAGDSGGWTLLLNLPDGRSCLLAAGENFAATDGLQPARGNPT